MTFIADTIFALSSGLPPAGIAVVRISGPGARIALEGLAGRLPAPRRASFRRLTDSSGDVLDHGIVLWFPGPETATGEDLAELHLHGGRAVVAGVLDALRQVPGLRGAEAGEFTRRAFENGRIDLSEAEGLSDLLAAETASQRRSALRMAGGGVARLVEKWQAAILAIAARIEAELDFSDEGDVERADHSDMWKSDLEPLVAEMDDRLSRPTVERLRDGIRVVLAGPPNSGKSSLINRISGRDVAIVSEIPGTTRDLVEAPVSLAGIPFILTDTAGLRDSEDYVEILGIERAERSLESADIILWLGAADEAPERERVIKVGAKADLRAAPVQGYDVQVSALTGQGLDQLVDRIVGNARSLLPDSNEAAINARHRQHLYAVRQQLAAAYNTEDLLVAAEHLRLARRELDRITGRAGIEEMLDALFGAFCIGK